MCFSFPYKIESIKKNKAVVKYDCDEKTVATDLVDEKLKPGDYVFIQAGFVIKKIDSKQVEEILCSITRPLRKFFPNHDSQNSA